MYLEIYAKKNIKIIHAAWVCMRAPDASYFIFIANIKKDKLRRIYF